MDLHVNGLIGQRQFWLAEDPFQRLMHQARIGLRSALSRLANEPNLTLSNRPPTLSDDSNSLEVALYRVKEDRRRQIEGTHSGTDAKLTALYDRAVSLLPDDLIVRERISKYNELIDGFNNAHAAIAEAREVGNLERIRAVVAMFNDLYAADVSV